MLPFEDRYTRQRQLKEVGSTGQERLFQLHVTVPAGPGQRTVAEYLKRAGAQVRETEAQETQAQESTATEAFGSSSSDFPHAGAFQQAEAREFAAAVHRALSQIRDALGLSSAVRPLTAVGTTSVNQGSTL